MYNYIILSSCLFGSIYIFSTSLQSINRSCYKKMPNNLIIINGLTFIISGSIFLYGVNYIKTLKET